MLRARAGRLLRPFLLLLGTLYTSALSETIVNDFLAEGRLYSAELAQRALLSQQLVSPEAAGPVVAASYWKLASILLNEADLFESINPKFERIALQQRLEALVMLKRSAAWSPSDMHQEAVETIKSIQQQAGQVSWLQQATRKLGLSQYARGAWRHFAAVASASGASRLQGQRLTPAAAAKAHSAHQDTAIRESITKELNVSSPEAFFPAPPMLESNYVFHIADALFQFGYKQSAANLLCTAQNLVITPAAFDGTPGFAALHPDLVLQSATLLRVCGLVWLRPTSSNRAAAAQAATQAHAAATNAENHTANWTQPFDGLPWWLDHPWVLPVLAAVSPAAGRRMAVAQLGGVHPKAAAEFGDAHAHGSSSQLQARWGSAGASLSYITQKASPSFASAGPGPWHGSAGLPMDALAEGVLMKRLLHCFNTTDVQTLAESAHPLCVHRRQRRRHVNASSEMNSLHVADTFSEAVYRHSNRSAWHRQAQDELAAAALLLSAVSHGQFGHWDNTATTQQLNEVLWVMPTDVADNNGNASSGFTVNVAVGSHVPCAQELMLPDIDPFVGRRGTSSEPAADGGAGDDLRHAPPGLRDALQRIADAYSVSPTHIGRICVETLSARLEREMSVQAAAGDVLLMHPSLDVKMPLAAARGSSGSAAVTVRWSSESPPLRAAVNEAAVPGLGPHVLDGERGVAWKANAGATKGAQAELHMRDSVQAHHFDVAPDFDLYRLGVAKMLGWRIQTTAAECRSRGGGSRTMAHDCLAAIPWAPLMSTTSSQLQAAERHEAGGGQHKDQNTGHVHLSGASTRRQDQLQLHSPTQVDDMLRAAAAQLPDVYL